MNKTYLLEKLIILLNKKLNIREVSWTCSVYGHGKALRAMIGYPEEIPILALMAHGVSGGCELAPHEIEASGRIYIGWQEKLPDLAKRLCKKQAIWIPHPYPVYRVMKNYKPSIDRVGTLAFYPHTTPNDYLLNWSAEGYLDKLINLNSKYHPISIMLHHHDLDKETIALIEGKGLKWLTCGNPFDPIFVDNFYQIACQHAFATSPAWGSQVAYLTELGVPYFFYGDEPSYYNVSDPNLPVGLVKPSTVLESSFLSFTQDVFKFTENPEVTLNARQLASELLGLERSCDASAIKFQLLSNYIRLVPVLLIKQVLSTSPIVRSLKALFA